MQAWKLGCKGITVYITGSREKVVLETKATMEKKDGTTEALKTKLYGVDIEGQLSLWKENKKPRPGIKGIPIRSKLHWEKLCND